MASATKRKVGIETLETSESVETPATPTQQDADPPRRSFKWHSRFTITVAQLTVIAIALVLWEYLPKIGGLQERTKFLDPYFISSPVRTFGKLIDLFVGRNGAPFIWDYVWPTFGAALAGTVIGLAAGAVGGLVLSSFQFLSDVLRPFVVALNAVPRIAMIPIIIVIMGASIVSSTVIAVTVVFFVGLFNAYEGGQTVETRVIHNAQLLGASDWHVMRHVRFPHALAWTLASLPIAVSFAIVSVVTGEILTGYAGLGRLIATAASSGDTDSTFAVIIVMAVLALLMLGGAEVFKGRVLHWWGANQ